MLWEILVAGASFCIVDATLTPLEIQVIVTNFGLLSTTLRSQEVSGCNYYEAHTSLAYNFNCLELGNDLNCPASPCNGTVEVARC